MTTQRPPGTDAARHGSGDADLTLMISAHRAFARHLVSLARGARPVNLANPARRQAVGNGWHVFKRQQHMHHRSEDQPIWSALRKRLANSDSARSVLAAMEDEHARIDPLLPAVGRPSPTPRMTGSPTRSTPWPPPLPATSPTKKQTALPLIGTALTGAEWKAVGRQIARTNGLSAGAEFFAWM